MKKLCIPRLEDLEPRVAPYTVSPSVYVYNTTDPQQPTTIFTANATVTDHGAVSESVVCNPENLYPIGTYSYGYNNL